MILQKVEITFIEYLLLSNLHFGSQFLIKSISNSSNSMHFIHLFYHPIYR